MSDTIATRLAYADVGTGSRALVQLSGWCGGRDVFDPLLTRPARRSVSIDLPGHGESPAPGGDFTGADVLGKVIEVVDHLELAQLVPVTLAHSGWLAIELRRALGPSRVPGIVLLDWMPLGPPPGFLDALAGLQDAHAWTAVRAQLFAMWTSGVEAPAVHGYVASMGEYGFDMWSRAGREIAAAFTAHGTPVAALETLAAAQGAPCPTLHLYAQPGDDGYLAAQQAYAAGHPWFTVHRLSASSHFPTLEVPDEIASRIEQFAEALR